MKVFDLFSAAVKDAGVTIQPTLGETHFSLVYANQSNSSNFNKKLNFFFLSSLEGGDGKDFIYTFRIQMSLYGETLEYIQLVCNKYTSAVWIYSNLRMQI